jgi:hypothetical protein
MSYRHARLLVDDMNNCFLDPVVAAQPAGAHGGGTILTAFGQQLGERYRAIEVEAQEGPAIICRAWKPPRKVRRRSAPRRRSSAPCVHQRVAAKAADCRHSIQSGCRSYIHGIETGGCHRRWLWRLSRRQRGCTTSRWLHTPLRRENFGSRTVIWRLARRAISVEAGIAPHASSRLFDAAGGHCPR